MRPQRSQIAAIPRDRDQTAPLWPAALAVASIWAIAIGLAIGLPVLGDNPDRERAAYTIWVATLFAIPAYGIALLGPTRARTDQLRKLFWTAGWAAYLVHFFVAVVFAFDGSIQRIYARQGNLVATYNFAITAIWTCDILFVTWRSSRLWRKAATIAVHMLVAIGFGTAELLFKRGLVFWLGVILFVVIGVGLLSLAVLRLRRGTVHRRDKLFDVFLERVRGSVYLERQFRHEFSTWELVKQAKRDLWAKEVQTGYTTTYVWMANQLGHFTLGLFPLLLVSWFVTWRYGSARLDGLGRWVLPAIAAAIIIWKELGDYRTDVAAARKADGHFRIDRSDLLLDAGTAVWYMLMGVFVGAAAIQAATQGASRPLVAAAIGLSCVFGPAGYWLRRKKCFQMSDLPFVFRFASIGPWFKVVIGDEERRDRAAADVLVEFVELRGPIKHLIVYGPEGAGKTSLTVATGTEHAFQQGKVRFMTFFQFLQIAALEKEEPLQENRDLWSWREAKIVLIDDVDAGLDTATLVNPAEAAAAIRSVEARARGRVVAPLSQCRTVWVLGELADPGEWRSELAKLLEAEDTEFAIVQLSRPPQAHGQSTAPTVGPSQPGPRSVIRTPTESP